MPADKKARHLASFPGVSELVAARLLVGVSPGAPAADDGRVPRRRRHRARQRHDCRRRGEGARARAAAQAAATTIAGQFPAADVALYLSTLLWQDRRDVGRARRRARADRSVRTVLIAAVSRSGVSHLTARPRCGGAGAPGGIRVRLEQRVRMDVHGGRVGGVVHADGARDRARHRQRRLRVDPGREAARRSAGTRPQGGHVPGDVHPHPAAAVDHLGDGPHRHRCSGCGARARPAAT